MKRLIKPISFLIVALTIASCSKDKGGVEVIDEEGARPLVDFQVIKSADGDPFSFEFKNKSSNFKGLEWRFGDDSLSTEESPNHLYLTTGLFEVTLKGVGEGSATGKKLVKINIHPDSVIKLSTEKTGVENQVKFIVDTKATIASANWTFNDDNTTSTDITPTKQYNAGSFNKFSVTFQTIKGSVITLRDKFVTTEGLAVDITSGLPLAVSRDNNGGPNNNEGSIKLTDGNINTKWLTSNNSNPMDLSATLTLPSPQAVKIYSITAANDADSRDPQQWQMLGSDDLITWTVLDTRDVLFNARFEVQYFAIANPKPFTYYRWKITKNRGNDGLFQVAEWRIFK